jgi:hypothetical protein
MDCHGRLYGFWQNLPKARRKELRINGELIIEPDFACLHPTLLYAMKGIRLDYDPYDTGCFPRDHGKLALNIGINCKRGLPGAVNTLMSRDGWNQTRRYTERLVDSIAARNEPIREFIGSDAGVRLMGYDSRMALDVLKRCRRDGVAVLPVHDSFMTGRSKGGIVTAHMEQVLDETRVRLSQGSSRGSKQIRLQMPPEGAAERSSSLPAEPGIPPSAEPLDSPPAEPVETLPGGEVALVLEGRETPMAEPLGVPLAEPFATSPRGVRRTPLPWVAASRGSLVRVGVSDPLSDPAAPSRGLAPFPPYPDPPGPFPILPAPPLAVLAPLPIHISPEVLNVTHSPLPTFPATPHWTLWRPDGTCHKGHRMFLQHEAEALIALGHNPFLHPGVHAGKVAPGLGNRHPAVVNHGVPEYDSGIPIRGASCTTA